MCKAGSVPDWVKTGKQRVCPVLLAQTAPSGCSHLQFCMQHHTKGMPQNAT